MSNDDHPLPLWRKTLAIAIVALAVGPLLFAMFYSAHARISFSQAFDKVGFYYPFLGAFVVVAFIIGFRDVVFRRAEARQ